MPADRPPAPDAAHPTHDPVALEALLRALRRGDDSALRELLPALREGLLAVARSRLEGGEAEEAVQDSLVILWQARDRVHDGRHLLRFAFQTLRHRIGNAYQARQRQRTAATPERRDGQRGAWGDPEHAARADEMGRVLDAAIERCAGENETWGCILGWLRAGRTPAEVRRALGDVSPGAVHVAVHRARQRLREILRASHGVET